MNNRLTRGLRIGILMPVLLLLSACYHDESSVDTRAISEIAVDLGSYDDSEEINVEMHDTLTLEPEVTQTKDLPLSYEWEVDQELFSTERTLAFPGTRLGVYNVRLKVSNEDGSTFRTFRIRVNSPYDQGLLLLSEDESGEGSLTFVRKYDDRTISETPLDRVGTEVYAVNNDGERLGKGITDIVKRLNQIFIASSAQRNIRVVNAETLELETVLTAPEYPDFEPYRMNIPDAGFRKSNILTTDGTIYSLATLEFIIQKNTALPSDLHFSPKTSFYPDLNTCIDFFWDPVSSKLWFSGSYYAAPPKEFAYEGQELVTFFSSGHTIYVLTRRKDAMRYSKTVYDVYSQFDVVESDSFDAPDSTFGPASITAVDERLFKVFYADGREIRQWYFSGSDLGEKPLITLDVPGEITALQVNAEAGELYVGVYDAERTGRKGSLLIYNTETGKKLGEFAGIADKPLRMIYKNKSNQ